MEDFFGRFVVRCVNYHGPEYQTPPVIRKDSPALTAPPPTSMVAIPLQTILPVTHLHHDPDYVMPRRQLDPDGGVPVRVFVCKICGYVEMYTAAAHRPPEPPANG